MRPGAHLILYLATFQIRWVPRRIGMELAMRSNTNPFSGFVASLDTADFDLLQHAVTERRCREKIGFGTLDEVFYIKRTL